jgi:hypothetical protein
MNNLLTMPGILPELNATMEHMIAGNNLNEDKTFISLFLVTSGGFHQRMLKFFNDVYSKDLNWVVEEHHHR